MHFLMQVSSKTDLSPLGLVKILSFIHDSITNE